MTLTLSKALNFGKLSDFVDQEINRGVPNISKLEFAEIINRSVKVPQSQDQTSGFHAHDDLSEK